jgi:hypothetical protein
MIKLEKMFEGIGGNMKNIRFALLGMLLFSIAGLVDTASGQTRRPALRRSTVTKAAPAPTLFRVNAGKRIHVRMNDSISSRTARVGDTFTVTTTEPVYSNTGAVVIPSGSEIVGRVTLVNRAAKGGRPGSIDASFIRVQLPNGYSKAISGSLTELDGDNVSSDSEGRATGDTMRHRKVIFIGGGGVGGAVLGGAVGGPKGALIGGILGAGAGLLGERYTKGKEVEVNAGTEFGVYLNQAVSLPRYKEVE